jgi:cysteine-rich repeat protein
MPYDNSLDHDLPDWRCDTNEYFNGYKCVLCFAIAAVGSTSCLSCNGPLFSDCTACKYIDDILVDGQCITAAGAGPPVYTCHATFPASWSKRCIESCDAASHNARTLECNDGNNGAGDGCSATCTIEAGYTCFDTDVAYKAPVAGAPVSLTTANVCEKTITTEIVRIMNTNENNIIIEFSDPI